MKKIAFVSLVGATALMSSAAFAGGAASIAQGVNFGSQTQIGVNNIQGQIQGVNAEQVSAINNVQAQSFQGHEAQIDIGSGAYTIGSIVGSGNGAAGGNAAALVGQLQFAKGETTVNEAFVKAEKGGEVGETKVGVLGLAGATGVSGGIGGAGEASISSVGSNNISIDNVSTSTADYHSVRFTKIDVDVNIEANVAVGGAVASKGGIVNGQDGIVVNDSGNGNTLGVPVM